MYGSCNISLGVALPREERMLLSAQLRSFKSVAAASVEEKRIRIWYKGTLPAQMIRDRILEQRLLFIAGIIVVHMAEDAVINPGTSETDYIYSNR